jgi:DHA2 family multidrug resistance protein
MAIAALPLRQARSEAEVYRVRYLIAFAVTLASVLELVDTSIVNVAIPHMMGNLGATLEEVAWVSTGYIVANVIILPLTPWLAARFGRRNYYTGSIILFTLASFFCGSARSLEALVFWRVIQGIGGGALISTAQAILFDVFPLSERGTSTAIFGMGVMVGPALGPTLGGWITDNYSWPWIFYINIPLGILAAYLTWSYVPEPRYKVQEDKGVDWLGLLFLIMGVGALQILLERGESKDWFESPEIITETVIAVFGMIGFVWHELTTDNPMVNLRVLKRRQLAVGVVFASILGFALYSSVFALPVFLQNYLGFSAWDTGRVLLPGAIATAVTMAVAAGWPTRSTCGRSSSPVWCSSPSRCGCTRTSRSRRGRSTFSGR